MAQYKVLSGTHQTEDGTIVRGGEVFESEREDLDIAFANKFLKMDLGPDDIRKPRDYDQTFDKDDVMDEPVAKRAARAEGGEEEEPPFGSDVNPQRFDSYGPAGSASNAQTRRPEAVQRGVYARPNKTAEDAQAELDEEKEERTGVRAGGEEEGGGFGEDVTSEFPKAEEGGYQVFKGKKGYTVVDADAPKAALNKPKDALTSKQSVTKFLGKHSKK